MHWRDVDAYSFIDFLLQNSICFKFSFKKFTVFQIGLKSIAFSFFKYERSIIQFYLHYFDTETSLEIFKHCVTIEANAIKNADNPLLITKAAFASCQIIRCISQKSIFYTENTFLSFAIFALEKKSAEF